MLMRTVRDTLATGINTVAELQDALHMTIQLEFSTIPPYLCAEWSINNDPGHVRDIVHAVVIQEMLHFGFACNLLTAVGGVPNFANPYFIPTYPSPLPGGVHPGLMVDLLPLGLPSLTTFLQIEYPENGSIILQPPPPPGPQPPTIGEFYDKIADAFIALFPNGQFPSPPAHQVTAGVNADSLTPINNVQDAVTAIKNVIKAQGEGASGTPDEGTVDPNELAHYYAFSTIYFGKKLVPVQGGGFQYSGTLEMPTVFPFQAVPAADQTAFITALTTLLKQLQDCWTSGFDINNVIFGSMSTLQSAGSASIRAGILPQFSYQP
jgi:Ferritin-like